MPGGVEAVLVLADRAIRIDVEKGGEAERWAFLAVWACVGEGDGGVCF